MKLISSSPPPRREVPTPLAQGWLRRRLRTRLIARLFSKQTAWWVFVAIVAATAYSIVHMFRQMIETMQTP